MGDDWEKVQRTMEHLGMQEALETTEVFEDELMKGFDDGFQEGLAKGLEEGRVYLEGELQRIREWVELHRESGK